MIPIFIIIIVIIITIIILINFRSVPQNFCSSGQILLAGSNEMFLGRKVLLGKKLARQWRNNEELRKNGETVSDVANHFKNFPTVHSAIGDDFTVLPTFAPTDTLEHLTNCRKNTRKSADAVAEFAEF